jgi:integrase
VSRVGIEPQSRGKRGESLTLEEPDEINRFKTESLFNRSPFHRFGVRLNKKAETARDRRLTRHEERCLLDAALQKMNTAEHQFVGTLLHDRIIGALELCCRRGEMLLIQYKRVNWETCQIGIPGATTKDKENRRIPFNPKRRVRSRRFWRGERHSAPTRSCSAAQPEPTSRTSRQPGKPYDYSRTASNRSPERRERNGTESSSSESISTGTTCVTKALVDYSRMASTSESFS